MASDIKKMNVENDSVIYEHIIPRSVRQKWMRQASVERLDIVLTHHGGKVTPHANAKIVDNKKEREENTVKDDFGESIVSHDIQDLDELRKWSEGLISPEEERAVFNAFGVKLRHTARASVGKRRISSIHEGSLSEIRKENTEDAIGKQPVNGNISANVAILNTKTNGVQLREAVKKPRPRSMPDIQQEFDYKLYGNMDESGKGKHKAYISPHAKIPWKRNLKSHNNNITAKRDIQSINDERGSFYKVNKTAESKESDKNIVAASKKEQFNLINDEEWRKIVETEPEGKVENNSEDNKVWQSVLERCKSFEYHDKKQSPVTINVNENKESLLNKRSENTIKNEAVLMNGNEMTRTEKKLGSENKMVIDESPKMKSDQDHLINSSVSERKFDEFKTYSEINDKKGKFKNASNETDKDSSVAPFSKDMIGNPPMSEDSHKILLDIFQKEPPCKPQKIESSNNKENMQSGSSNVSNEVEKTNLDDKMIAPSALKNYEKKINKMVIRTGEQREKQIKSGPGSKQTLKVSSNKELNASNEKGRDINVSQKKGKEELKLDIKTDIPVTNLDDTMTISPKEPNIPVTNLDEPFEPPTKSISDLLNNKTNAEKGHTKKFTIQANKKPGKYDADRRALVAPKVFFEKPVTGLVSSLSPKGKQSKKKKMRVSFSSGEDLQKVHLYPSESAAIEMYDAANEKDDENCITNIDDALASEVSPSGFQSYMPSTFANLTDTLDRERSILNERKHQSNDADIVDSSSKTTVDTSVNRKNNALFTETAIGGTSAMLF